MKTAADFWAFSKAGRELGDLHLNYETVEPYPVDHRQGDLRSAHHDPRIYRVEKMTFGGKRPRRTRQDRRVIYNDNITITGIPLEAYDYVVNGKPALEWVMERQCVKTDKDSGIVNDANDWAIETMEQPGVPAGTVPARHHRQPGDDEDRQGTAEAGRFVLSAMIARRTCTRVR